MLTRFVRENAARLYRAWAGPDPHSRPMGTAFHLLSLAYRASRGFYHRIARPQPPVLLALDGQSRLKGCGSITGWALGRDFPIVSVEAFVCGKRIANTRPDHDRADLWQRFPMYRSKNLPGFRLCPAVDVLKDGRHDLLVRATNAVGNQHEICTSLIVDRFVLQDDPMIPSDLVGSNREYQLWLREHDRRLLPAVEDGPLISVIMPIYRPTLSYLQQAITSVQEQTFRNWELYLSDDGSNDRELTKYLELVVQADERIHLITSNGNQGISAATNLGIKASRGEFAAFMDQDDRLHPQALQAIANAIGEKPGDLYFTDEDRLDAQGRRVDPFFKPGWSVDLLHSMMYLGHLCVYQRAWLDQIGLLDSRFDGTQDWELALRSAAQPNCRVVHVAGIFYHWRVGGHSATKAGNRLCHERGQMVVAQAVRRQDLTPRVKAGPRSCTFHIRYPNPKSPKVSILIPSKDQTELLHPCLQSLRKRTNYQPLEIIVIDNGSGTTAAKRYLNRCCADRVLHHDIPFNHSWLNNKVAQHAQGELLLFLNDDIEALHPNWLQFMVEQAQRPEVGAVGAWLVFPDGKTQHSGIKLCPNMIAQNISSDVMKDGLDRGTSLLNREVSAVTGACLMIPKKLFQECGGFDAQSLPTSFNDVDLCLRLRQRGYRIIQCPQAKLIHHESSTRKIDKRENQYRQIMQERWEEQLQTDRFWNPNLAQFADLQRGLAFHWQQSAVDSPDMAQNRVSAIEANANSSALQNFAA